MNITRYWLDYSGQHHMTIDVDHDVFTAEKVKEWNEFWSGAEDRERRGRVLKELLKMTLLVALRESVSSWSGTASLREGREEGFPKMDGSECVTIIAFHDF